MLDSHSVKCAPVACMLSCVVAFHIRLVFCLIALSPRVISNMGTI